ncbi:DUF6634 family protein [Falsiroseomonas sp. HW251]|uniref:DUF6634 family protein n=1 Tax=Falsiroseomonas sp. HW251 TaxID=3390998 RepID=UPI003D310A81
MPSASRPERRSAHIQAESNHMTIPFGRKGRNLEHASETVRQLRRLADDLVRIQSGEGPSAAELADAPLLVNWAIARRDMLCLSGDVLGHPLMSGPGVTTSRLWLIRPSEGWARTESRYYRLGAHVNRGVVSPLRRLHCGAAS